MYGIEEFAERTAGIIRRKLGEGYKVKMLSVEKINTRNLYALVITNGKYNVSPNFYLEGFYSRYIEGDIQLQKQQKVLQGNTLI